MFIVVTFLPQQQRSFRPACVLLSVLAPQACFQLAVGHRVHSICSCTMYLISNTSTVSCRWCKFSTSIQYQGHHQNRACPLSTPTPLLTLQHDGNSPHLQPDTQQLHSPHSQQKQQHCSKQGVLTGNGLDGLGSSPVVCGLLPPVDLAPVDLGAAVGGCSDAPRGASGALGSSESDDTPQHQLSTPTAEAAASIQQQQPAGALNRDPQAVGLLCQPGVVSMALTPGTSMLGLPAGLPVPGKPPAAGSAGLTAQSHQPPAAAAAGDAAANGAVVAGQPVMGVPHLLPAAAAGFGSPQVMQQLAMPHAAAAAAMAAARTAGSVLSGPAAMGLPAKLGEDSSNGSFAGFAGSSSSNSQWCTPVCRRSLSSRGPCFHCGTTYSSQWRSGPPHKPVLCNACGLYYRKVQSLPDHTCQVAGALEVCVQQCTTVLEAQQYSL